VHFPSYYIDQTVRAVVVYLRPSSNYEHNLDNLRLIAQWDRIYSLVVDGQPAALFGSTQDRTRPKHSLIEVGYFTLIEIMVVLVGTVALARTVIRHRQTDPARAGWLLAVGTTPCCFLGVSLERLLTRRARVFPLNCFGPAVSFALSARLRSCSLRCANITMIFDINKLTSSGQSERISA
jgi:hypothetical protein